MIQRIQSVFLFLASIANFLLFFFPIAKFEGANIMFDFYAYGISSADAFADKLTGLYNPFLKYVIVAVVLACIATPFIAIFLYKNRPRQVYLSRLTILLNVALLFSFFILTDSFSASSMCEYSYGYVACAAPVLAIIFLFLAMRYIKKDIKLIRSADRIR